MKHIAIIFIFVLLALATAQTSKQRINVIPIGDHVYFTDLSTNLYDRTEALEYCKSQGAELAKVTNKRLYDDLRVSLPSEGAYWIDGIDKQTQDRFTLDISCSWGALDFSEMAPVNLVLRAKQCLALVKGSTVYNSRIEAIDCIIPNRVLCSLPRLGCDGGTTTTTTTMASGD